MEAIMIDEKNFHHVVRNLVFIVDVYAATITDAVTWWDNHWLDAAIRAEYEAYLVVIPLHEYAPDALWQLQRSSRNRSESEALRVLLLIRDIQRHLQQARSAAASVGEEAAQAASDDPFKRAATALIEQIINVRVTEIGPMEALTILTRLKRTALTVKKE